MPMSERQPEQARFDHVDSAGGLVFVSGDASFVVQVDDDLEHAILEAKQIMSESGEQRHPAGHKVPISQIQTLVRAGAEPSRVAERYGLSETLVRRFSASVETEKQYAIRQFLSVPASKESRKHTISEVIDRSLAAARVRPEDVQWRATRRGLEPWKISAQFKTAGRTIRAEWTWNMQDNTVTALNRTAQTLLGETTAAKQSMPIVPVDDAQNDYGLDFNAELPGDSARSARIEQTISAWATPEPSMPPLRPEQQRQVSAGADADAQSKRHGNTGGDDGASGADASVTDATAADQHDGPAKHTTAHTAKPAKRRSGRSAVPSWDEILFGD